MMKDCDEIRHFFSSVNDWVCDEYYLDIKYIGRINNGTQELMCLSISANPLPSKIDAQFEIKQDILIAGHLQKKYLEKKELMQVLRKAAMGLIELPCGDSQLIDNELEYSIFSEMLNSDRWFSQLHLQLSGKIHHFPSRIELLSIDNMLRMEATPFDGLSDLASWLGFDVSFMTSGRSRLDMYVGPPVDLIFLETILRANTLAVTLRAHSLFSVERVSLALVSAPCLLLSNRRQVTTEINWSAEGDGIIKGKVNIELESADSVLIMLLIGNYTVRRQWIIDPAKARNYRLLSTLHFDDDLKMIKSALFKDKDSLRFEAAISSLFYMLGFSSSLQVETDSPDLIVSTPNGRILIIECTIKVSDFSAKIGKLVNRRGSLSKYLKESGHPMSPIAILICRTPRDEVANDDKELLGNNVILMCQEELNFYLSRLRELQDPDQLISNLEAKMNSSVELTKRYL